MGGLAPFNPSYAQLSTGGYVYNGLSGIPADATSAATLQQAMQAWFAQHPQYASDAGQTGSDLTGQPQSATDATVAAMSNVPQQTITPATIQSQFPGGIPQTTASGLGNLPAIQPGTISAQQVMGSNVNPTTIDPAMSIAATEAYLNPQFAQQDAALTANLANAGIVGGTTGKAIAQLGQQQQTTLQNNIQPFLQAGALANQSTNLQGQLANQGNALQAQGMNQGANLTASQAGLNAFMAAQAQNQQAALQGGEFNATAQNQAQMFNIQNLLQTGQIDAATANQMQQYIMGMQNQDWLAQLGAQTQTVNQGANNVTNAYQPIYQQPAQSNLNGIGSVIGSGAFQAPRAQQPTTTGPTNVPNSTATTGGDFTYQGGGSIFG